MSGFIIYSVTCGSQTKYIPFSREANLALISLQRIFSVGYKIFFRKHTIKIVDSKTEAIKCLNDPSFQPISLALLEEEQFSGVAEHHPKHVREEALKTLQSMGFSWLDELPD